MNADEIEKADEIVRELRAECVDCSEKDCCDHGNNPVKYCPVVDAADLIKQLQIELGNRRPKYANSEELKEAARE